MQFLHLSHNPKQVPTDSCGLVIRRTVLEEPLVAGWHRILCAEMGEGASSQVISEPIEFVKFDLGGMMLIGEPVVTVELDGVQFTCMLRQVEYVLPTLRTPGTQHRARFGQPYHFFQMRWHTVILTAPTAQRLTAEFEQVVQARRDEVAQAHGDVMMVKEQFKRDGVMIDPPRDSDGSASKAAGTP